MRREFVVSLVFMTVVLGLTCFAVPFATAQQFTGEIDLNDSDPNSTPDSPFGATLSPDGRFLMVCISGDPDFSPDPPDLNNNEVRIIDRATDSVVNVIQVGFFPVECAVTTQGSDNYLWVCNSSDGNVSVFRVANGEFDTPGSITEEGISPISTGAFSFPNGVVASADQNTVWVGTSGGTGEVFAFDADPNSGTFGNTLDTVLVTGSCGRLALHDEFLVIPHTSFAFPLSHGLVSIVDTGNTADIVTLQVTPTLDFNSGEFVSMIDTAVTEDGYAYTPVFGPGTGQDMVVIDVPNRTIARSFDLTGILIEDQHGISIAPDGRYAALTNFTSHEVAMIDLRDDSIQSIITSPNNDPNEVVWSLDSCTAYITNQNTGGGTLDSVGILERFPDRDLILGGTTAPSIGDSIDLTISGGCEGRKGGILSSEILEAGVFRGLPVPIGGPISVVQGGIFDVRGEIVASTIAVPNDPGLIGKAIYYLAGAKDAGGVIRLSNVHTVIYQP